MADEETQELTDLNYAKGLERFMGNRKMYHEFMYKFLYDSSFEEFFAGVAIDDRVMAKKALHTLKGTSANLSLEKLYEATKKMYIALEENQGQDELLVLADSVRETYSCACDAVREYIED